MKTPKTQGGSKRLSTNTKRADAIIVYEFRDVFYQVWSFEYVSVRVLESRAVEGLCGQ